MKQPFALASILLLFSCNLCENRRYHYVDATVHAVDTHWIEQQGRTCSMAARIVNLRLDLAEALQTE